jgi:DNA-binding GntR family transcriptional regulator
MAERVMESALEGSELLSKSVKRLLLERIMTGHYKPGERLVEVRLAKELGTSQAPVREALRELAGIGIVTIHSRRGARVRMPTGKELADVSLVRSELDALAARVAVPLLDEATLRRLAELYDQMTTCLAQDDHVGLTRADADFHRTIAKASANHAVLGVFDQLEPFARTFITLTLPNIDVKAIVLQHSGILAALQARDADQAAAGARRHQLDVSELFAQHHDESVGHHTG